MCRNHSLIVPDGQEQTLMHDPASGIWTTTDSLTAARDSHTATLLPNGKVLVAGGYHGGPAGGLTIFCFSQKKVLTP